MSRTVDVFVTCLRTSSLDTQKLDAVIERLQPQWRLDNKPELHVVVAEPGRETDAHISRIDLLLSTDLAAGMDSPWGIDALGEPLMQTLKETLRVNTVVLHAQRQTESSAA